MKFPVIVIVDNDDGAKEIFGLLKSKKFNITISHTTDLSFYHLGGPLYLIKTPCKGGDHKSRIEDFFDQQLLETRVGGKKFNPDKKHEAPGEYGKVIFAEQVVRPQAKKLDFSGFQPLLRRLESVLDDYTKVQAQGVSQV